jgi:hypothetical protein
VRRSQLTSDGEVSESAPALDSNQRILELYQNKMFIFEIYKLHEITLNKKFDVIATYLLVTLVLLVDKYRELLALT